jgi:WD40 repeat protein
LPKASWLDGNCPICLMRLAARPGLPESFSLPGLGDYQLLEEIGRGGMGVVYRARQVSLNRQVALKVLPGGRIATDNFIQRFSRETQALASLQHPNIVGIHEVGEYEGQLYFSMNLIQGHSLAEEIRDNPLPCRQAAQLIEHIAEAVAFAHERGVLHRDLKPSNILLDNQGVPHITDFGLAKRADGDVDLTLTGEILGSPNYMAPEQADPNLGPATPASDVYSLGAMLYHLLTGRPPFMAETVAQTLRLLAEGGPVPLRLVRRDVSRDLETICLKCLETAPALRYQSAQELAQELNCFLRDKPIRARPVGPVAKLVRWCRRKPALAAAFGIGVLLFLVVTIGSPVVILRIRGEREASDAARKKEAGSRVRAELAEREARRQLYTALVEQAHAAVRSGELGQRLQTLEAIRRAAGISNSLDLRLEAIAAVALPDLRFERELSTGRECTLKLLDPAFATVALCSGIGPVELRDTSNWLLIASFPASTNLPAYAGWWSPDRRYLAIKRDQSLGGEQGKLEVWEVPSHQRVLLREMANQAVSFHPVLHRLIVGQTDGGVTTWDLENGSRVSRLRLDATPEHLEFSPDGERFATVQEHAGAAFVSVYDATSGAILASHSFNQSILSLTWHPSGRWLGIGDEGGTIHRMDSQTGQTREFGSHKAQAAKVVFSPDGDYLFSGGWEGELICWDTRTLQRCLTVGRHSYTAQFRSDGQQCALLTASGIELHAFVRPNHREFFEDLGPRLRVASFSPDGRWLAASADQLLAVWDLTGGGPAALSRDLSGAHLAFMADGKELFAIGNDDRCGHWRIVPGTNAIAAPILQPIGMPAQPALGSLALVSNIITGVGPPGSRLIPPQNERTDEPGWINRVRGMSSISPDAQWMGSYQSFSPFLEVYHLPSLEHVTTLQSLGNIISFGFPPGANEVAVSSRNGVEFWSTNTWTRSRVLTNFIDILFSPEGSAWWLTMDFRNAGLYEANTLKPLLQLPMGTLPLAISPDGRFLAVGVGFRHLQVWDLKQLKHLLKDLGLAWWTGSG